MANKDAPDYYYALGIEPSASLKEINTAYRKKSLRVHPDRNPDDPKAADLFHELTVAYETLKNPTTRQAFDADYKARQARKERFAQLDSQRQAYAEDLLAREKEVAQKGEAKDNQAQLVARLKQQSQALKQKRMRDRKETLEAAKKKAARTKAPEME